MAHLHAAESTRGQMSWPLGPLALAVLLAGCSGRAPGGLADLAPSPPAADLRAPPPPAPDLSAIADLLAAPDLAPDRCAATGDLGPAGDRLRFAVFGDTRPASPGPGSPYPSDVVTAIFRAIDGLGVQFVVVSGDYIYVNGTDDMEAARQMGLFLQARQQLRASVPVHYVLGNHEKQNIPTFQAKLSPDLYWRFDQGRAKFVAIANDAWDDTQAAWLKTQLADPTHYTFVFRHQYWASSGVNPTNDIAMHTLVSAAAPTLFIAGHDHSYKHKPTVVRGELREVVAGNGGAAPLDGIDWYGFLLLQQQPSDCIQVTAYKIEPGMDVPPLAMDTWSVTP